MQDKGPFREQFDPEAEALKAKTIKDTEALEKMEKEIRKEGKVSILLPENIKQRDPVPLFEDALENNIDPKDIVFYSLATGILKHHHTSPDSSQLEFYYTYNNPDNKSINLNVLVIKKNPAKLLLNKMKYKPATLYSLSTKAEVEAKTEEHENWSKENRKNNLIRSMNRFEQNIQQTKELVEKGVDKELEETFFAELKEKRTSLKLLLDTIDDKLEEKK